MWLWGGWREGEGVGESHSVESWGNFLDRLNGNPMRLSIVCKCVYIYSPTKYIPTVYIFDAKTNIFHILIIYEVRDAFYN